MNNISKYILWLTFLLGSGLFLNSCEKFLSPDQELAIRDDQLYDDWYEYRSIEMGLYGLQQRLAEQLMVLGELRGDLLEITPHASADLVEIYNFAPSRTNPYIQPTNFFKLISACNNFIRVLKMEHPEVLDPESPVNNYDRLYGEALCMRAWAYFNAVRIYGKVPYINESLTTIEEVENFVESPGTYIDSVHIIFGKDGYTNDTLYNQPIELEKYYLDVNLVIDQFAGELEKDVKAVGVNHYIVNDDDTWEVSIWSDWGMYALLGHMYLTEGNLAKAAGYFIKIMKNTSENNRYHLDNTFNYGLWGNIFTDINTKEHIYTIWFSKSYFQQNNFQTLFEPWAPHKYMLKPTYAAILKWESQFRYQVYDLDLTHPEKSKMADPGIPSDYLRGIGRSYLYVKKNGEVITEQEYTDMIMLRRDGDDRNSRTIMEGMDTVVYKYSIGKGLFNQDANYIIYRAGGIHLYLAEIYLYWRYDQNGQIKENIDAALGIINDGTWYSKLSTRPELGVRGRVGLGGTSDKINVGNINYIHDPFTNKIIGYLDLTGQFQAKQEYLEDQLMDEKARELAYEGERFYDLMRAAKRRNDPSYLAKIVSDKFPAGKREEMYNFLLDESNWYIHYFE